ncbi:phosphotriesterase-related protein [Tamaricihabitans halophyticus]|uniref:Phosphotriesterase-related protein n=1 Tax=Tamaricihabitans halophyticus TaxID=1262583 RepID=A0A4R2QYG2_9PSEU|nr:aryldialkylphosphatase [Tamaricihabitans halophyticus]TCP54239.1 phosphotriesterase-related protein [Tamaricihabitans halophyticus]
MPTNQYAQTVLGPVPADQLGHTQTHEHLLSDLSRPLTAEATATERKRDNELIRLDNYYEIRRYHSAEDLRLHDVQDAVDELLPYRAKSGGAVVEASSIGLGRDPLGMAEIAKRTGVHIVMGCGYYCRAYHPPELDEASEAEVTARIVRDVQEGVDETGIRAGIIGEIGLSWPVHPVEQKVLRAAIAAQRETGAALLIHPGRGEPAPLDAMRTVESLGGQADRVIMSHIDRTLFDTRSIRELAATGCYVEFDLFGQESSYYPFAPIDMPNDATRVDYIADLISAGYLNKVLIAQDICSKTHMRKYGGEGYTHILDNVLPLMRRKGFTEEQIHAITVDSPAHVLPMPL